MLPLNVFNDRVARHYEYMIDCAYNISLKKVEGTLSTFIYDIVGGHVRAQFDTSDFQVPLRVWGYDEDILNSLAPDSEEETEEETEEGADEDTDDEKYEEAVINFDVKNSPPHANVRMWLGISDILSNLYMAHNIRKPTRLLGTPTVRHVYESHVYKNFLAEQMFGEVKPLLAVIARYTPDYITADGVVYNCLNALDQKMIGIMCNEDYTAIRNYTAALYGKELKSPRLDQDTGRCIQDFDYAQLYVDIVAGSQYRHESLESEEIKRALHPHLQTDLLPGTLEYVLPGGIAARANAYAQKLYLELGLSDIQDDLVYVFRDRIFRDSLPADVIDSTPLEKLRVYMKLDMFHYNLDATFMQNQRYYIPNSIYQAVRWAQAEWTPDHVVPGLCTHWSVRMDALRSDAPTGDQALDLKPHPLGIFVESKAFRRSMVQALFLAYEFSHCPLFHQWHTWASFVSYYDRHWPLEIMIREHEYFNRVPPPAAPSAPSSSSSSSRTRSRRSDVVDTRRAQKARLGE